MGSGYQCRGASTPDAPPGGTSKWTQDKTTAAKGEWEVKGVHVTFETAMDARTHAGAQLLPMRTHVHGRARTQVTVTIVCAGGGVSSVKDCQKKCDEISVKWGCKYISYSVKHKYCYVHKDCKHHDSNSVYKTYKSTQTGSK